MEEDYFDLGERLSINFLVKIKPISIKIIINYKLPEDF